MKRISAVQALKIIDKALRKLENGEDRYKVLAALAVLHGNFCVEDLNV